MDKTNAEKNKMQDMMAVARRRELNFAFCLGRSYETALLLMHRWHSTDKLRRDVRQQGETIKIASGKLHLKSKNLTIQCDGSAPTNTKRQLRLFLREHDLHYQVEVLENSGEQTETTPTETTPVPDTSPTEQPPKPSKLALQWAAIQPAFEPAVDRTVDEDGPKAAAIAAAWKGAIAAAENGQFSDAIKVAKKIKPLLVQK